MRRSIFPPCFYIFLFTIKFRLCFIFSPRLLHTNLSYTKCCLSSLVIKSTIKQQTFTPFYLPNVYFFLSNVHLQFDICTLLDIELRVETKNCQCVALLCRVFIRNMFLKCLLLQMTSSYMRH